MSDDVTSARAKRDAAALNMEEYVAACTKSAKERQKASLKKGKEKPPLVSGDTDGTTSPPARTRDKIAATTKTSPANVARASAVKKKAPDLFKQMERGEIKTNTAYNQMQKREKTADLKQKAESAKEMMREEPTWTLIHDDVLDGLRSVKDHHAPARLIFADPPYNIGLDYGDGAGKDDRSPGAYIEWVSQWLMRP